MMLWLILAGLACAAAAPGLFRWWGSKAAWLLALHPLAFAIFGTWASVRGFADGPLSEAYALLPELGMALCLRMDGLSLLFVLLVGGVGALVLIYAGGYLEGHPLQGRFFLFLLVFMSAMFGVVLADDLIALFVFWELTSLSSYMLIGFHHESEKSRSSALQALLVTGSGGLALLAGVLLLGNAAGTFQISAILSQGDALREHELYLPIFALIALGAFTKSAQFPFHFWLPNAMAAPTPVSAYLHSATMVKAGIYLLARLDPVLGATPVWTWTLSVAGLITMSIGALRALRETDLKRVLAFSTITALGTLTLLIGLSFEASLKAAVVFLVVHSLYKAALFMVAGNVDHETGTREVGSLGGLRRLLPWTAGAALVASFSMAGFPPLFGFIGKELAYKAKLGMDVEATWWVPAIGVLANAFTVTAALVVALRPFWGTLRHPPEKTPHEAPPSMLVGPVVLAAYCLFLGIYPGHIDERLIAPAVQAVYGAPAKIHLALWYGINLALLLSIVTVAVGLLAYFQWDRLRALLSRLDPLFERGMEALYFRLLHGLVRFAELQTGLIMAGGLRRALSWTVLVIVLAPAAALVFRGGAVQSTSVTALTDALPAAEAVLLLVVAAGAVTAAVAQRRLLAIASIGVMGFGIALLFQMFRAPDLAITQLMVETLFVLIVVLVLPTLPKRSAVPELSGLTQFVNAALALCCGAVFTVLLWSVSERPFSTHVSRFFAEKSFPEAFGQNVVNVVLVDFRATDTLGEIAVLAVAALGVVTLLKVLPLQRGADDDRGIDGGDAAPGALPAADRQGREDRA